MLSFLKKVSIGVALAAALPSGAEERVSLLPERKTYLPDYRMSRFFPLDAAGGVPYYEMAPFPAGSSLGYWERKKVMPRSYREARGEVLIGGFTEILYFTHNLQEEVKETDRENLAYLTRLSRFFGTELSVCLAGSSDDFLPVSSEEAARKGLRRRLGDLAEAYGLKGIDVDWEFPRNDEEREFHRLLLTELKGLTAGRGMRLSMAVSKERLLKAESYALVDRVNLMAYDYYGRHSTPEYALEAMEYMTARHGIPPEKLIAGIPFYGRIFEGFSPDYWSKSQSYMAILEDFAPSPSEDEAGGFYFNGPDTVREKLEIAAEHALQGVFAWEVGQDTLGKASLSRVLLEFPSSKPLQPEPPEEESSAKE